MRLANSMFSSSIICNMYEEYKDKSNFAEILLVHAFFSPKCKDAEFFNIFYLLINLFLSQHSFPIKCAHTLKAWFNSGRFRPKKTNLENGCRWSILRTID